MVDTGAGKDKIKDDARCDAGDVSVGVLETWDKLFAAFEEVASSVTSVCYRHFWLDESVDEREERSGLKLRKRDCEVGADARDTR